MVCLKELSKYYVKILCFILHLFAGGKKGITKMNEISKNPEMNQISRSHGK